MAAQDTGRRARRPARPPPAYAKGSRGGSTGGAPSRRLCHALALRRRPKCSNRCASSAAVCPCDRARASRATPGCAASIELRAATPESQRIRNQPGANRVGSPGLPKQLEHLAVQRIVVCVRAREIEQQPIGPRTRAFQGAQPVDEHTGWRLDVVVRHPRVAHITQRLRDRRADRSAGALLTVHIEEAVRKGRQRGNRSLARTSPLNPLPTTRLVLGAKAPTVRAFEGAVGESVQGCAARRPLQSSLLRHAQKDRHAQRGRHTMARAGAGRASRGVGRRVFAATGAPCHDLGSPGDETRRCAAAPKRNDSAEDKFWDTWTGTTVCREKIALN
eukprot:7377872-Prymnesium_polylepis.1